MVHNTLQMLLLQELRYVTRNPVFQATSPTSWKQGAGESKYPVFEIWIGR